MDFGEVTLLMQQLIERKRAENGEEEPADPAELELLELIGQIREEKKRFRDQHGAA